MYSVKYNLLQSPVTCDYWILKKLILKTLFQIFFSLFTIIIIIIIIKSTFKYLKQKKKHTEQK